MKCKSEYICKVLNAKVLAYLFLLHIALIAQYSSTEKEQMTVVGYVCAMQSLLPDIWMYYSQRWITPG